MSTLAQIKILKDFTRLSSVPPKKKMKQAALLEVHIIRYKIIKVIVENRRVQQLLATKWWQQQQTKTNLDRRTMAQVLLCARMEAV
mgnify:CR=1 FL=1